ncbi:MAG TPA: hypothetical protein VM869_19330 [Enhygromyxa sp.]|jgi:hypothetical protein|nr:hypothetical protein [Enhygromyxa sp.]
MEPKYKIETAMKLGGVVAVVVENTAGTWVDHRLHEPHEWGGPLVCVMRSAIEGLRRANKDEVVVVELDVNVPDLGLRVKANYHKHLGEIVAAAIPNNHPSIKSFVRTLRSAAGVKRGGTPPTEPRTVGGHDQPDETTSSDSRRVA